MHRDISCNTLAVSAEAVLFAEADAEAERRTSLVLFGLVGLVVVRTDTGTDDGTVARVPGKGDNISDRKARVSGERGGEGMVFLGVP
jgi:hypothetical protein